MARAFLAEGIKSGLRRSIPCLKIFRHCWPFCECAQYHGRWHSNLFLQARRLQRLPTFFADWHEPACVLFQVIPFHSYYRGLGIGVRAAARQGSGGMKCRSLAPPSTRCARSGQALTAQARLRRARDDKHGALGGSAEAEPFQNRVSHYFLNCSSSYAAAAKYFSSSMWRWCSSCAAMM